MQQKQTNDLNTLSSETLERLKKYVEGRVEPLIIVSTYKLSEDEKNQIVKQLQLDAVRDLVLENDVDPQLLGGLVIKYGSFYIDYSLRGSLNQVNESLGL